MSFLFSLYNLLYTTGLAVVSFIGVYWPMLVPLLLGALAIYWLMPRPRPFVAAPGILFGALALILGGWLMIQTGGFAAETVLFYLFSGTALVAGTLLITQSNPARAALSFALVVLSSCGLFLLLAAPFLMAATIIIYAGAIIVTFLFVIMLAQQSGLADADVRSREPFLAVVTGFVLLGTLLYILHLAYGTGDLETLWREADKATTTNPQKPFTAERVEDTLTYRVKKAFQDHGLGDLSKQVEDIQIKDEDGSRKALERIKQLLAEGRNRVGFLQTPDEVALPVSSFSGPQLAQQQSLRGEQALKEIRRDDQGRPAMPAENSAYLGRSLFTDYLLPIEIGGLLLLAATIGAIAITYRQPRQGRPT